MTKSISLYVDVATYMLPRLMLFIEEVEKDEDMCGKDVMFLNDMRNIVRTLELCKNLGGDELSRDSNCYTTKENLITIQRGLNLLAFRFTDMWTIY